jgi:hypothetical protein
MQLNGFDLAHVGAARPLPVTRSGHGWRGAIAALGARLASAWVSFYAAPPRRLQPLI